MIYRSEFPDTARESEVKFNAIFSLFVFHLTYPAHPHEIIDEIYHMFIPLFSNSILSMSKASITSQLAHSITHNTPLFLLGVCDTGFWARSI